MPDGYKYEVPDGHFDGGSSDDSDDEESGHRAVVESQRVTVTFHRPDDRDLRYHVHVEDGDRDFYPLASLVDRAHRIAESSQWDPMGRVDWTDIPIRVRQAVADAVAGVDDRGELDPGFALNDHEDTEGADD